MQKTSLVDLGDLVDGENQLLSVTDGWDSESFGTFLFYNELLTCKIGVRVVSCLKQICAKRIYFPSYNALYTVH